MRILIIEDDEFTASTLASGLRAQNYAVEVTGTGRMGEELVAAFPYDLLLLDILLPDLDGISLCRRLRSQGYTLPILLLTGRDSSQEKVEGLDAGADDYLVKPFDLEELVARVRALLRRGPPHSQPILQSGDLQLDPRTCEANYRGQLLPLTPKEYALLELLLRHPRQVFSCGAILEHLWCYQDAPGAEAVRTHIKGLRQKLKAAQAPADLIQTVYGIGYRLKPLEKRAPGTATAGSEPLPPPESSPASPPDPCQLQMRAAIQGVWQRFQGRIHQQMVRLEQASQALEQHQLTPELRQQAIQAAHTLVGTLGTLGYQQGSCLAQQIVARLRSGQSLEWQASRDLQQWVVALRQEISPVVTHQVALSGADSPAEFPLVLIVAGDRTLAAELRAAAETRGLQTRLAPDPDSARTLLAQTSPAIVLLDLAIARSTQEGLALLAELHQQQPSLPVLVLTDADSLSDHLEVARLGGRAYLHKPIPAAGVIDTVVQVLHLPAARGARAKVMIVDDDPQLQALLRSLLEPWGLAVTGLTDPRQFWVALEATLPDLLLLDLEMPDVNGLELCQIVRDDCRWGGLPILILTAHPDAATVNQVFARGADDLISKPIVATELAPRILKRLERIQRLCQTGLGEYFLPQLPSCP